MGTQSNSENEESQADHPEPKSIIQTLVSKAKDPKSRSLTNILGGGTVAGLLLWENAISSATVICIATEIWVLSTIIVENWIAQALLRIIAFVLLNLVSLALASVFTAFYLDKCVEEKINFCLNKVEGAIGSVIDQYRGELDFAGKVIGAFVETQGKSLTDTIKKSIKNGLDGALWPLYESVLQGLAAIVKPNLPAIFHSKICQEFLQMLLMISEGSQKKTFYGVVASLQVISIMCIFFPPTTVLYIGYLCVATLPALCNKLKISTVLEKNFQTKLDKISGNDESVPKSS
ncbi:PREDICTED: uncharacterized protein LOC18604187 isoform X2 [Theobroma cacao]|uniref:Uncharacterized protein LOC18604187 isoform X2 n=1 Tax=Theobroma cacao TaxID=3641 RepID=A0AB32W0P4_THECC|nr:PREDICTED: uncharacterized protein LOC18604187 isoform X2 [Theobroma cacao]